MPIFNKNIIPFLNPVEWMRAVRFKKKNAKYDRASYDLELEFYSKILGNNMLHYGYFENPEIEAASISLMDFEAAQIRYARNLLERVEDKAHPVLDVGCGMGALSEMLRIKGFRVESLTPDKKQVAFIAKNYPKLRVRQSRYEEFECKERFGTILHAESLQYIPIDRAIARSSELILPGGRWIVCDYFSRRKEGAGQKPHHLETFLEKAKAGKWRLIEAVDITVNVLPTLHFINLYLQRIVFPAKHLAYEKLRYKQPKLYYLSRRIREGIDKKLGKESRTVNPEIFRQERQYMLVVLEKTRE